MMVLNMPRPQAWVELCYTSNSLQIFARARRVLFRDTDRSRAQSPPQIDVSSYNDRNDDDVSIALAA